MVQLHSQNFINEKFLMLVKYRVPSIFFHTLYSTMRDIFEFNHIDQTLSEENVKLLKDLYGFYLIEKLHRGF